MHNGYPLGLSVRPFEGKLNRSIFGDLRLCGRTCEGLVAPTLSVSQEVQDDDDLDTKHSVWFISAFRKAERFCEVLFMPQFYPKLLQR